MALNTIFLLCSYKRAQTQTKDKSLSFALQVHCHNSSHAFDTVPNFFSSSELNLLIAQSQNQLLCVKSGVPLWTVNWSKRLTSTGKKYQQFIDNIFSSEFSGTKEGDKQMGWVTFFLTTPNHTLRNTARHLECLYKRYNAEKDKRLVSVTVFFWLNNTSLNKDLKTYLF